MTPLATTAPPTLLAMSGAGEASAPPAAMGFAALVQAGEPAVGGAAPGMAAAPASPAIFLQEPSPNARDEARAVPGGPSALPTAAGHGSRWLIAEAASASARDRQVADARGLPAPTATLDNPAVEGEQPLPSTASAGEVDVLPETSAEPLEPAPPEQLGQPTTVEPASLPVPPTVIPAPAPVQRPAAAPEPSVAPVSSAPAAPVEEEVPRRNISQTAVPGPSGTSTPTLLAEAGGPAMGAGSPAQPVTARAEQRPPDGMPLLQHPPAGSQLATVHAVPVARAPAPTPLDPGFGERVGLTLARRIAEGRDEVTVRMEPAELGRVQVRLSFDEAGSLRALVSADSALVLDSLRREAGDLARTLADNGVRTDGQSFRFDRGGGGGQSGEQQGRPAPAWTRWQGSEDSARSDAAALPQPLRHRGRLNLMA